MGGNHESTATAISHALGALHLNAQVDVLKNSNVYQTDPMGTGAGDQFLNAACLLDTSLAPIELLDLVLQIETDNHRTRQTHWGPRTLDLDLIFYGDEIIAGDRLTVPHPDYWYRRFVLDPAADVCPEWVHPTTGISIAELRDRLHAAEFRVSVSGDVDPDFLTAEFRTEFGDVRFEYVAEVTRPPASGLGIHVSGEPCQLPPMWLNAPPTSLESFVRDVLTAARGQCQRLESD